MDGNSTAFFRAFVFSLGETVLSGAEDDCSADVPPEDADTVLFEGELSDEPPSLHAVNTVHINAVAAKINAFFFIIIPLF